MAIRGWKDERMARREDGDPKSKEIEMCFIDTPALSSTPQLQLWDPAGFVVNDGGELEEYAVDVLGTAAARCFARGQEQAYWFELELRLSTEAFSGTPTHASRSVTILADSSISFPQLRISDLLPDTEYKWVARLATQYCHCVKGGTGNWTCSEHRITAGHWIHGGTFHSGADRVWQALAMDSVQVTSGTLVSGNDASLSSADRNYHEVATHLRNVGGLAIHVAEVEVRFAAIPRIRDLRARFVGHSSRGSEFSLLILQDEPPAPAVWVSVITNSRLDSSDQTLGWTTEPSPPESVRWWIDENGLISTRIRVVAKGGPGIQFATDLLTLEALAPL